MEAILLETMFDLPGLDGVEEVVISADVVNGNSRPLYIYGERAVEEHQSAGRSA
jgi:ATP-dependent Clp protease ATP-binding subunit ClpX